MSTKRSTQVVVLVGSCSLGTAVLEYMEAMHHTCSNRQGIAATLPLEPHSPHTHSDPFAGIQYAVSSVSGISATSAAPAVVSDYYVIMKAWPYGPR